LSILILRDQSYATVDVCATVLSKPQNAFFSLSSLIKERKEIFCVYVIKESIATSGNVRKCHLCYRPLGDARDARQASAPPLRRPSDLRSPQSPTSSHPPYRLSTTVRAHHVVRGTYAHWLRALPLVAPALPRTMAMHGLW